MLALPRAAMVVLCGLVSSTVLALDVPYLTGRITDNADLLDVSTRQQYSALLEAHERKTGNQIAVLTVSSLEGESLEEFATKVFRVWKLGQKNKNNGVLVLIAPAERKLRIEVGYGLEGVLTDLVADQIIRTRITPAFKNGNYPQGIGDGLSTMVALLEGETIAELETRSPTPVDASKSDSFFTGPDLGIGERILFGGFIFGIIGLFTFIGIVTPGVGWFIYFFLIPFWAMFPIIVLGTTITLYVFFSYLIGFPILKLLVARTPWARKASEDLRTKGHAKIGGFVLGGTSGSSGGSSSSRSSSSSGGFSGGGGSSGGGGASGSW